MSLSLEIADSGGEDAGQRPGRRWAAGIVNHGSYDELEACLASLGRQSLPPVAIRVYDTGIDPSRSHAIAAARLDLRVEVGANIGFAGGANRVVARLQEESGCDFVLVLNPDVVLDPLFAERLVSAMAAEERAAIATGKLLRADRQTIDSAGIVFPRHRRPRDRGSEEPDRGQFDRSEWVEGASGAAMLLRASVLDDLSIEGEIFDESFFVYHEDTDLCWRARRFGYRILYDPAAVAIHAREWKRERRFGIPPTVRRHSFKNHYLQLVKNETLGGFLANLPWLVGWEVLRFGFVLIRDRALLAAYGDAARALPQAFRRRALVQARAASRESGVG